MTLKPEQAMRVLIERLNWPVRFVRWQAAREFAALFSSSKRALATGVFLDWLQCRQFETEVVAGMAVLMCAVPAALPPADDVRRSVQKPSILADILFQRLYRFPLDGWLRSHSGSAPIGYQAEGYFERHMGQVVPQVLSTDFRRLEREGGFPFQQQWAFEWQTLMDATNSPHSSFPHYFINRSGGREGIGGQFSQAQCNVYRSAFLRTLAFAVHRWGMPRDLAAIVAARCLPLSKGLLALRPIARPPWLKDIPEKCCKPGVSIEVLARRLIRANIGSSGMRPISLRIPISNAVAEFGELSIESFYATSDFSPKADFASDHRRMIFWQLADLISFEGELPEEHVAKYRIDGATGWCAPVCLSLWPSDFGFWQSEYFHLGVAVPAPYAFDSGLRVESRKGWVGFSAAGKRVGYWKTWNDNWTPIHAKDGHTRCGGLTELKTAALDSAAGRLGMNLIWYAKLSLWKRPREYGAPEVSVQTQLFAD